MVDMIWNIFVAITSYDEEYHEHLSILRHIQFISYWNYSFSNKQHIIKPKRVDLLTVHVCVLAMRLARTWMQYVTSARGRDDDVAKKMAATTPHTYTHTKSATQSGPSEKFNFSSFSSLHVESIEEIMNNESARPSQSWCMRLPNLIPIPIRIGNPVESLTLQACNESHTLLSVRLAFKLGLARFEST